MSEITTNLLWHIAYDLLKYFVEFVISTAPVVFVLRKMSSFLDTWKKTLTLWASVSLTLALAFLVIGGSREWPHADFKTKMAVGYGGEQYFTDSNGQKVSKDSAGEVLIFATLAVWVIFRV
jgi:hypothetical protein